MSIRPPDERIGEPLIGFDRVHLIACRESNEASIFVESNAPWSPRSTLERRNVSAVRCEGLQARVASIGDDDSTVVVDAYRRGLIELPRELAERTELEQERTIDGVHEHSVIGKVSDDDTIVVLVELDQVRDTLRWQCGIHVELEQVRTVDGRQYLHALIETIDHHDSISLAINAQSRRLTEHAGPHTVSADAEQERKVLHREDLQSMVQRVGSKDTSALVVDRNADRAIELTIERALMTEHAHKQPVVIGREHLDASTATVRHEHEPAHGIERHARDVEELTATTDTKSSSKREPEEGYALRHSGLTVLVSALVREERRESAGRNSNHHNPLAHSLIEAHTRAERGMEWFV